MKQKQQTIDAMIEATIQWWTNYVKETEEENDTNSSQSHSIGHTQEKERTFLKKAKERFAEELTNYLKNESQRRPHVIAISTHKDSEYPLVDICKKAKISHTVFPEKTTMWVDFQKGTVRWLTLQGPDGKLYPPFE